MTNPVQEKNGGTVTANLLTGLGLDEFFTRTDGVGTRGLLPDALGSTVALGDGTGTLQTQYTYEPFGYVTQTGSASTSSYKYTGREDDGSALHYYRARYYHPRLQRFIAEDPVGIGADDVNLYAYVDNSPVNWVDPLGLAPSSTIGGQDPGFSDPEKMIKQLEKELKDPNLCQRDKEKIKRRIKELRRRPSKKQQHHYEGSVPPVVIPPISPAPLSPVPSPGLSEIPPVARIPVFPRFVFP